MFNTTGSVPLKCKGSDTPKKIEFKNFQVVVSTVQKKRETTQICFLSSINQTKTHRKGRKKKIEGVK